MGRLERLPALAAACVPALLMLVHQPATAGQAVAARAAVEADSLEPAKAAIRIKNYGAAAQLLSEQAAQENADAQYLLGTLLLADLLATARPGTSAGDVRGGRAQWAGEGGACAVGNGFYR